LTVEKNRTMENEGVKEWKNLAKITFDKYLAKDEAFSYSVILAAINEAAQVGYERGFKNGDARDIQNQYVIEHTQAGALALLQKLTHHNDVVGTLVEMILENAKLKLQVLDQATIIENLRTDRNNYRNLYEDLKQHPGIMNINKQAEPISKPYKPCKNLRPESE